MHQNKKLIGYFSEQSRHIVKPLVMKSLFKKIIGGQKNNVPQHIKETLDQVFNNPTSIEWAFRENYYEALFYQDKLENIAKIDLEGKIFEYRINQPLKQMPDPVRASAVEHGEIMNCISIHLKDQEPLYEIIIRDKNHDRSVLLIKASGEYISQIKL